MARFPHFREFPILLRATALVVAVRLALWIVPFVRLRRMVFALARPRAGQILLYQAEELSCAVRAVSRYVPRASCLTQALVLHILLRREGRPSKIQVGVNKTAGRFHAHAWVESDERIVIGKRGLQGYSPMMVWD
jgi:Transglutaminase-like superfamily